jgi:orotate phosphoribosyltransferase
MANLTYSQIDLIGALRDVHIIKAGEYTLKSGLKSNIYFDFKRLCSYPVLIAQVCQHLSQLTDYQDKCIAGVPMGAIPYATLVSHLTNTPMSLIREERKTYGTQLQIEGDTFGKEMVLIEDVITTGQSVCQTLDILKTNNIKISTIVCVLDREQGGVEKLKQMGYQVVSLFQSSMLMKN